MTSYMATSLAEWNTRQKVLRHHLEKGENFQAAIALFFEQHAAVHDSPMVSSDILSFADKIWKDITEEGVRRIPSREDYSIAWVIWHMSRVEDMTMNVLVAGTPQLVYTGNWFPRLKCPVVDTGNAMDSEAVRQLSNSVDIDVLRQYRIAVGRRTREIVKALKPGQLKEKVLPERIQQLLDEGAVVEEARGIVDYWSKRTIAGLLLMPPTRHNMVHINQALRIKTRST
jgi:hypothetical protein